MGYPISLQDRAEAAHENSKRHGWWENQNLKDPNVVAAKLALIHSEVSEALEAVRDGQWELPPNHGVMAELADVCIRVFDLSEGLREQGLVKTTIEDAIRDKMMFNETRPMKHGGKAI